MALKTPSYVVIGLAIVALGALAVHKLYPSLKNKISSTDTTAASSAAPNASGSKSPASAPPPPPPADPSAPLGSKGNPLRVSLVSFSGYAPGLLANGKSLTTQPGSIYDRLGTQVEFLIEDGVPTLTTMFEAGTAQCAWRTSDFWAQEQPNLRNSKHDARAVVIVDNTRGADAIIARDPKIQRVEDLAGRKVALLEYTPSHGLLIDALENSSLSPRQRQTVQIVPINVEDGTGGVAAALASGNVDAAVLWDPDLALALKNPDAPAHVVYSTKTASNLIYDVMVCDQRVLEKQANYQTVQNFVTGWMQGVTAARQSPDEALAALLQTEQLFQQLEQKHGADFIKSLFPNLLWTDVADNGRVLGFADGNNHYASVYRRFDGIYRSLGALANPNSPVINPRDSFDERFIRALYDKNASAQAQARKAERTFTAQERAEVSQQTAAVTKPVTVNFETGSAELSKRAQQIIDTEMVQFINNMGNAYFEISGNTDSTGARAVNMRLSQARAQRVVDYLVKEWEMSDKRFNIVGNGPDKPICNESNLGVEGVSLEECRARNRTTRIAVYGR